MKKILLVSLVVALLMPVTQIFADQGIRVFVDGDQMEYDTQPIIQEGTTLVPLRQTFEALHADVDWNDSTKTVTSTRDNTTVTLKVGDNVAYKNGQAIELDIAPQVINGRTYIPLRFVAESFGADVEWRGDEKVVYINSFYIVDDYDPNYVETEYVAYSSGDLDTLLTNVLNGNVVVINGEYYATPEYATRLYHGLHTPVDNSNFDRQGTFDDGEEHYEWIAGISFEYLYVEESELEGVDLSTLEETIPGYYSVYGFFDHGFMDIKPIYLVPDMTEEFMNSQNATGTFSGIRMQMEDGILFFNISDLNAVGVETGY